MICRKLLSSILFLSIIGASFSNYAGDNNLESESIELMVQGNSSVPKKSPQKNKGFIRENNGKITLATGLILAGFSGAFAGGYAGAYFLSQGCSPRSIQPQRINLPILPVNATESIPFSVPHPVNYLGEREIPEFLDYYFSSNQSHLAIFENLSPLTQEEKNFAFISIENDFPDEWWRGKPKEEWEGKRIHAVYSKILNKRNFQEKGGFVHILIEKSLSWFNGLLGDKQRDMLEDVISSVGLETSSEYNSHWGNIKCADHRNHFLTLFPQEKIKNEGCRKASFIKSFESLPLKLRYGILEKASFSSELQVVREFLDKNPIPTTAVAFDEPLNLTTLAQNATTSAYVKNSTRQRRRLLGSQNDKNWQMNKKFENKSNPHSTISNQQHARGKHKTR